MSDQYKPYPDAGTLHATQSKRNPKSADYFGEIAINLRDTTNIQTTEDGLTMIKLSGWKKVSKSGKTYLSISVNRFVPKEESAAPAVPTGRPSDDDDNIPF